MKINKNKIFGLKKILRILSDLKKLNPIFYECTLDKLNVFYLQSPKALKLEVNYYTALSLTCLNLFSTELIPRKIDNILLGMNIRNIPLFILNRFHTKREILTNGLDLQLKKEIYCRLQKQNFTHSEKIIRLLVLNNYKLL